MKNILITTIAAVVLVGCGPSEAGIALIEAAAGEGEGGGGVVPQVEGIDFVMPDFSRPIRNLLIAFVFLSISWLAFRALVRYRTRKDTARHSHRKKTHRNSQPPPQTRRQDG